MTLFADAVLRAATPPPARPSIFIPLGTDPSTAHILRQTFATIAALEPCNEHVEAARLGCTHVLDDGVPLRLTRKE